MLFNISVLLGTYKPFCVLSVSFSLSHCSASIKKLQEQNDSHQVSRAKMAEGMALALEKKDQVKMRSVSLIIEV